MSTFTIPSRTISAGVTVLGPMAPGAGLNGVSVTLDIANEVDPMSVLIEQSPDGGVTWRPLCSGTWTGPWLDRHGVLQTTGSLSGSLGQTVAGPVLTTASSLVRATISNTTAFPTAGGTLSTF